MDTRKVGDITPWDQQRKERFEEIANRPPTQEELDKLKERADMVLDAIEKARQEEEAKRKAFRNGPVLRKPSERKRRRLEQRRSRRANRA